MAYPRGNFARRSWKPPLRGTGYPESKPVSMGPMTGWKSLGAQFRTSPRSASNEPPESIVFFELRGFHPKWREKPNAEIKEICNLPYTGAGGGTRGHLCQATGRQPRVND